MKELSTALGAILLGVLLMAFGVYSYAFLAMKTYQWFMLPLWPSLPVNLTLLHFLSIKFFLSTLFVYNKPKIKSEFLDEEYEYLYALATPWASLCVLYLLKILLF